MKGSRVLWLAPLLIPTLWLAGCGGTPPAPVEAARSSAPAAEAAARPEAAAGTKAPPAGAEAVEAVREEAAGESWHATGRLTINENRSWQVGAVTEGRIVKVLVNQGDAVQANQVLARMHSHEVHEGRAEYRKAVNEVARAKAAESYARQVADRAKRLFNLKAGALEQVERAEADIRNAQASVEQAQAELERTKTHLVDFLGVSLGEAEGHPAGIHTGEAHGDDDLIPVRAPAAGTLLERKVSAGSVAAPAAELFVIADLSTVWMQAAVPESSISKVRPGQLARVSVQAQPGRTFTGRVVKLGEQLDPATRTLPVRIELANPGRLLRPEMYADAEFAGAASSGAGVSGRRTLTVAESALQDLKGQTVVFVEKAQDEYEPRAVEPGRSFDGRVVILNGLSAGERVVVKGAFVLKSQLLKKSLAEE